MSFLTPVLKPFLPFRDLFFLVFYTLFSSVLGSVLGFYFTDFLYSKFEFYYEEIIFNLSKITL